MLYRLRIVKSILWAAIGVLVVVSAGRFLHGLGPATGLSNAAPWGIWIAFDVMAGVALAAGGFVLAAIVYIFGLERYRPLVRPAILTAFLGYTAVAVGLVYDLGLPWHIWHPMIYPQDRSVLFEVAMCVMLYLTVLALEFAPVVLEHPLFNHPLLRTVHRWIKKVTIVLVIAGIVLSTLHQSSLGSLFLITPYRLHPLWYSPIIYVLFFISAVALGLATVIMESVISGWLLGHRNHLKILSGLGLVAPFVLGLYVVIRLVDLAVRGSLSLAFQDTWPAFLFLIEIGIGFILPAVLLALPRVRNNMTGLAVCAMLIIFGVVLNRFSVAILAFARPAGMSYFPTWTEIAVSVGVVSGATLVFLFFAEHLKVYSEDDHARPGEPGYIKPWRPSFDPASLQVMTPESLAAPRRYSLVVIVAASVAVGLMPRGMILKPRPPRTPVQAARTIEATEIDHGLGQRVEYKPVARTADPPGAKPVRVMMIDGNRNGRFVFFSHDVHVEKEGGDASCVLCHHLNKPFDEDTACWSCHRDMYEPTDIFSHSSHVAHLDGNAGCVQCHTDPARAKTRATATSCIHCHTDMIATARFLDKNQRDNLTGLAPGYMEAMHGLCRGCHERLTKEQPDKYPASFAQCDYCHGDSENINLRRLGPYLADKTVRRPTAERGNHHSNDQ